MDIIDKDLKLLALENRELAFERVLEKYEKQIFLYIYSLTSDYYESLDIMQEVFIKAFNENSFFNLDFNIKAWLYKVSMHMSFNFNRKIKNYIKNLFKFKSELKTKEIFTPYENYISSLENQNLYKAIVKLNIEHRQIIMLRFFEDMSYKEIAEVMSLKEGTVMSKLSRAKIKLKEVMENV